MEQTLAIIKPDAVGKGLEEEIIGRLKADGFSVVCSRRDRLAPREAMAFYAVHEGKPFFDSLVEFMSGGEIMALLLERDDAIGRLRAVIGATDPAEAAPGTVRADFAESKERNAIHASDSLESAVIEIPFFFSSLDAIRAGRDGEAGASSLTKRQFWLNIARHVHSRSAQARRGDQPVEAVVSAGNSLFSWPGGGIGGRGSLRGDDRQAG